MEQGAVPTQRAKWSVLKFLQHRIVPSGCLAKRSTIGQDMHSPRASAIEQSAARQRTLSRASRRPERNAHLRSDDNIHTGRPGWVARPYRGLESEATAWRLSRSRS